MIKKIDSKNVLKAAEYNTALASWKWYITSGAAKKTGYLVRVWSYTRNPETGKWDETTSFQKHRKSALTAEHMIIYNLIRGKEPSRGFRGEARSSTYQNAVYNLLRCTGTKFKHTHMSHADLSAAKTLAAHEAQILCSQVCHLEKLAAPFGLSGKVIHRLLTESVEKELDKK